MPSVVTLGAVVLLLDWRRLRKSKNQSSQIPGSTHANSNNPSEPSGKYAVSSKIEQRTAKLVDIALQVNGAT